MREFDTDMELMVQETENTDRSADKRCSYELIYYTMWEAAQRYGQIAQFRVIGKSHDDRMIPMLEIGKGEEILYCVSGLSGTDRQMPACLIEMIGEYLRAWECGWKIEEIYDLRELLDQWRLFFIPVVNPDGYEICEKGFSVIRNPIYRQMLRMQEISHEEYFCNARGMDLRKNFPTAYYRKLRVGQQPASENETKALVHIFQESPGRGLLSFSQTGRRILYFRQPQSFAANQRSYRLARRLQRRSGFAVEKFSLDANRGDLSPSGGSPERFYAELCRQPSFRIEFPAAHPCRQLHTLPLEYLFSLY